MFRPEARRCNRIGAEVPAADGKGRVEAMASQSACPESWHHYDVNTTRPVTVRIPEEIVHEIDLERRPVPVSRNNWILEAAIEKLRKGSPGGANGTE
jgi:hypothetical protein